MKCMKAEGNFDIALANRVLDGIKRTLVQGFDPTRAVVEHLGETPVEFSDDANSDRHAASRHSSWGATEALRRVVLSASGLDDAISGCDLRLAGCRRATCPHAVPQLG